MHRRQLLRAVAGAGALPVAGCLGDGVGPRSDDADPTDGTETPDDATGATSPSGEGSTDASVRTSAGTPTATHTRSPTDTATPSRIADRSFEVTDRGCGRQFDDATVSFDGDRVSVTGTVWGNDLGYTAVLAAVRYEGGTLTVTVAAERERTTGTVAAGQCIAEVDYTARVVPAGALPETVVVRHRRGDEVTTVATAER